MIRGAAGAGCATCCCCTFSLAAFLLCVSSKQGGAATPRHVLLLQLQLELVMVMILLMVLMCSPPVEDTSLPADFHLQFFIVYTSFVGCKLCVARRTIGAKTNSLVVQQSSKAGALLANGVPAVCPCSACVRQGQHGKSCRLFCVACKRDRYCVTRPFTTLARMAKHKRAAKRSSGEKLRRSEALQR